MIDPGKLEQSAFDDGYLQALREVQRIMTVLRMTRSKGDVINLLEYEVSTLKRNLYKFKEGEQNGDI